MGSNIREVRLFGREAHADTNDVLETSVDGSSRAEGSPEFKHRHEGFGVAGPELDDVTTT